MLQARPMGLPSIETADPARVALTATDQLLASVGGKVEPYDFGLGTDDVSLVADVPSAEAIVAASLTGASHGGLTARTSPLLSPAGLDAAVKLSPQYRAPGE